MSKLSLPKVTKPVVKTLVLKRETVAHLRLHTNIRTGLVATSCKTQMSGCSNGSAPITHELE